MPTYDYKCGKCGHVWEVFENMSEMSNKKCSQCGGSSERQFGAGLGIIDKGTAAPSLPGCGLESP